MAGICKPTDGGDHSRFATTTSPPQNTANLPGNGTKSRSSAAVRNNGVQAREIGTKDPEKGKGARGNWGMSKTDSAYSR